MSLSAAKRSFAEQHAFNREVLERLWQDPALREAVEKIETDRDGNPIMSPAPSRRHAWRANRIARLLERLGPGGISVVEQSVSTLEGIKVPDAVWYSPQRALEAEADPDEVLSTVAPDLCVEVLSPSNTKGDIEEKMLAYFEVGVQEVWVCGLGGEMSFYGPQGPWEASVICPQFPKVIPATLLP
jgi:Uma2 family endonuclease